MRAYTQLLIRTCHAEGGVCPSRRDPEVNERALTKVRDDKERESADAVGWSLGRASGPRPRRGGDFRSACSATGRKDRMRDDVHVAAAQLVNLTVPTVAVTLTSVEVALKYIEAWPSRSGSRRHSQPHGRRRHRGYPGRTGSGFEHQPITARTAEYARVPRCSREGARANLPTPVPTLDGTMRPALMILLLGSSRRL